MNAETKPNLDHYFRFDIQAEVGRISRCILNLLRDSLRRRGLVVAVSGGIDSSVACGLAAEAVGKDRVLALLLPERESSDEGLHRGREVCEHFGIPYVEEDISSALEALGSYRWRDEAIRRVFPEYGSAWRSKIAISGGTEGRFHHFKLIVEGPEGRKEARLRHREYLQIVAATNFKQRVRKTLEYFHADRLNYAVVGTPNRLEYDQGFFVKNGDGSADIKPIAHLYKTQVYMLARHLGLPRSIIDSAPTTDTYSLPQGQDEFYFSLHYESMDLALWHRNEGKHPAEMAQVLGITEDEARLIYSDIDQKRLTTAPLHWPAILVESVEGPYPFPPETDGSTRGRRKHGPD